MLNGTTVAWQEAHSLEPTRVARLPRALIRFADDDLHSPSRVFHPPARVNHAEALRRAVLNPE